MKAQGPGNRAGGFAVPFGFARFYIQIKPLATANPGGIDANGNWLHMRYSGSIVQATRSSATTTDPDYAEPNLTVEFDADGVIILPYCGNVDFVGGVGDYLVNVSEGEHTRVVPSHREKTNPVVPTGYQPVLHALTSHLELGTFTVPDWHTRIWTYNPLVTLVGVGGPSIVNTPNTEPGTRTVPGARYTVPGPLTIVTAWFG